MVAVIIAAIIAIVGIGMILGSRIVHDPDERSFVKFAGVTSLVVAVFVVLLGSVTTVGANKVGVVTSFGRYQGTVGSGIHMMAPWSDVEEFGTRIQPLEMGVPIRFQGNSGGTANLLVEWRIEAANEAAIKRLWSDYRTFDAVQNRVVQSNTRNALNVVLAGYTPSEGIAGTALQPITDATLAAVQARLRNTGVIVERVTIRQIDPDQQSQDRINRQVQAEADLERTATTKRIAEQEAETAAIRQRSQTPSSLQYECIRVIADWDASRQGPMPQTLNCNFGGQSDPVIVGR
jgi:regulator of protease activity HflC (stomatin/prohibitin superfamily)